MAQGLDTIVRLVLDIPAGCVGNAASLVFFNASNVELGRCRGAVASSDTVAVNRPVPAGAVSCSLHSHGFSREGVALAKTGRIYGMDKGKPGERWGGDYRAYTHQGEKLTHVFRIEFDADTDEGMATVSLFVLNANGGVLLDPEANRAATATCRLWLKVVPKGEAVPVTPEAVLVKQGDTIVRFEKDPMPDDAVRAMGGTVEHTEVVQ